MYYMTKSLDTDHERLLEYTSSEPIPRIMRVIGSGVSVKPPVKAVFDALLLPRKVENGTSLINDRLKSNLLPTLSVLSQLPEYLAGLLIEVTTASTATSAYTIAMV